VRYPRGVSSAAAVAKKACPRCGATYELAAAFCPKDGARLAPQGSTPPEALPDPYIGTTLAGDIEIRDVAGSGAMGTVYRAHQQGIERDVAVKILHRELSGNAHLVQRFHREAKIASKLQHPHVVEVYLAGQLPDGALYIVMEYLDGTSLAGALATAGDRLPIERVLSVTLQICDAVGEGHARGIIHRDLKPENVMLIRRAEATDWVKVLDFGIAKVNLGEQSMETAAGLIFGTARYISPEGAQGAKVGPPGDVYAIATMVYQMLSGKTPFDGEPLGLLIKHIHEEPPPLRSWPAARDVPEPIAALVMANLAKDPTRRAPNARAFGTALAKAARQANVSFSDVGVIARLSQLPEPQAVPHAGDASQVHAVAHAGPIDPTLDDVSGLKVSTLPQAPLAPPAPPAPLAESEPPVDAQARTKKPWGLIFVLVAFFVGVGGTIAAMKVAGRGEAEHAAYIAKTRRLLADGHYVAPPGANVQDLVAAGLERWPEDATLEELRSQAEHEMITMAITARASGDLVGARNLARDAYALDPTDNSARYMHAQADDELEAISTGAGLKTGGPRLVFESPPVVKPGQRVDISCHIIVGSAGPNAKIGNMKLTLRANGKTSGGAPVTMTAIDATNVRAVLTAPGVGSYDVAFEANVDGTIVRAMRDLDVAP
jgi:serine/threonine protein kinase